MGHACFLDLRKTFDTFDHKNSLAKIKNVSSGEIQKLRRKFQSEKMSVHLPETYRNKKCLVRNGFLQGSVFGPYHFLLHINDLSSVCETHR